MDKMVANIPNLDFMDKLNKNQTLYWGDEEEYYGMDRHNRMLSMLNKVNKVFNGLSTKTLFKLQEELVSRYGNEVGRKLLHNVKMVKEYTNIEEVEKYKEMLKCLDDTFKYKIECMLQEIILHYTSNTSLRMDYIFINYRHLDGVSIVYKGKAHKGYLVHDTKLDENSDFNKQLARKIDGIRELVEEEIKSSPDVIEITYDVKRSDVNCTLNYRDSISECYNNSQLEWFKEIKEKYNFK